MDSPCEKWDWKSDIMGKIGKKRVSGLDLEAGGAVVGFKKNMLCMSESSSKPCD